jgi:cysteine synthase
MQAVLQQMRCKQFRHGPGRLFSSLTAYEQTVGNTRLLRLKAASESTGCNIYGKAEWENPGASVKDRAALWMIKDAEQRGILERGKPGIIVEGTVSSTLLPVFQSL